MCIIVVKEKNKELPSISILKQCWDRNHDGAGIMYSFLNKVHIEKGFMKFENLLKRLVELDEQYSLDKLPLIIHFRIATSGNIDQGNCHPYPLTDDVIKLRATNIIADVGVAHNGIITRYNRIDPVFNDTQLFIKNELIALNKLDNNFYKDVQILNIISNIIDSSRFVFLNGNGDIYRVGNWIEDNGFYYSNTSYKNNTIKSIKSNNKIDFDFVDYEEDNEIYYVDNEVVDEDTFQYTLDTLDRLNEDETVLSDDFFTEYNTNLFEEYYLDTLDKIIYQKENNTLYSLGGYVTKDDL